MQLMGEKDIFQNLSHCVEHLKNRHWDRSEYSTPITYRTVGDLPKGYMRYSEVPLAFFLFIF